MQQIGEHNKNGRRFFGCRSALLCLLSLAFASGARLLASEAPQKPHRAVQLAKEGQQNSRR